MSAFLSFPVFKGFEGGGSLPGGNAGKACLYFKIHEGFQAGFTGSELKPFFHHADGKGAVAGDLFRHVNGFGQEIPGGDGFVDKADSGGFPAGYVPGCEQKLLGLAGAHQLLKKPEGPAGDR
jgi:hypothetical protein